MLHIVSDLFVFFLGVKFFIDGSLYFSKLIDLRSKIGLGCCLVRWTSFGEMSLVYIEFKKTH